MIAIVVVLLIVGAVVVFVFKIGDDLSGWLDVRDRWRGWKARRTRRPAPYAIVAAVVVAVYVLATVPAARTLGMVGVVTTGDIAWFLVRVLMRLWVLDLFVVAGVAAVKAHRKQSRYMGGETADRRGVARAALRHLAGDAVTEALPALRSKGEGQSPRVGSSDFFAVAVGGRRIEYGVRVRLHMQHGMNIAKLRSFTSDGLDPEHDTLATFVNASLRDLVDARGPEARQLLAASKTAPVFPTTSLAMVRTKDGSVNPVRCDLLLLRTNPLRQTYRYPARRPLVRSPADPILVGVTIEAQEASAVLQESHTSIWGMTGSGKSFYALNLMIGASQCPNVAFVVLDMKGVRGDLMSMSPRAAAAVHELDEATVTLEWLVWEMERRSKLAGSVGKLTTFSPDMPEIIVWADEWHEWLVELPDKEHAERRLAALERLLRRARAFGIYLVASTQIIYAQDGGKRSMGGITGQFHNTVSTRLKSQAHTNMVFPNQFSGATGPHHIPRSWKGVAYGQFGEDGEITMIRSLLSGPDVAAKWAQRDADAGLNVPLPGLTAALDAYRVAQAAPVVEPEPAKPAKREWLLDQLPGEVRAAVEAIALALDDVVPEPLTPAALRTLRTKAGQRIENGKNVDAATKAAIAPHREAIRQFLNPNT